MKRSNTSKVLSLRIPAFLAYLVLGGMTLLLYYLGFSVSSKHSGISFVFLGVWIIGILYEVFRELEKIADNREVFGYNLRKDGLNFISVFLGAIITFLISNEAGYGAVVAASLIGVLAAVLFKPVAAAAYCGAFVGMASCSVFRGYEVALAGGIAGLFYVLGKNVFSGYGGKLGTTAFTGCVFTSFITKSQLLNGSITGWEIRGLLVLYCITGAVVTFLLGNKYGYGAVMASGIVGIIGGISLPYIYGNYVGSLLAVAVFCASFAGMSGFDRFKKTYLMVPAGVLCALVLIYGSPFLGGAGGKLGTSAFGAVLGLKGLSRLAEYSLRGNK